mgnify:CR=1 FL=1
MARFCTGLPSIDRNDNVQYVGKAISYESNVQQVENVALPTNRVTLELLDQTDTPGFRGILLVRGLSCLTFLTRNNFTCSLAPYWTHPIDSKEIILKNFVSNKLNNLTRENLIHPSVRIISKEGYSVNLFKKEWNKECNKTEENWRVQRTWRRQCTNVEAKNKGFFIEQLYHLQRNILFPLKLHSRWFFNEPLRLMTQYCI